MATDLSGEALQYFSGVCSRPFSQQAVAFLNAYWPEIKPDAEFIYTYALCFATSKNFSVAWETIKLVDMYTKHTRSTVEYVEGNALDFDNSLRFYEQLCKVFFVFVFLCIFNSTVTQENTTSVTTTNVLCQLRWIPSLERKNSEQRSMSTMMVLFLSWSTSCTSTRMLLTLLTSVKNLW